MNISINLKDLKDLLSCAFDCGWNGYRETKEDFINKIIEDYIKNKPNVFEENKVINVNYFENNNPNYYSYCTSSIGSNQLTLSTTSTNDII